MNNVCAEDSSSGRKTNLCRDVTLDDIIAVSLSGSWVNSSSSKGALKRDSVTPTTLISDFVTREKIERNNLFALPYFTVSAKYKL